MDEEPKDREKAAGKGQAESNIGPGPFHDRYYLPGQGQGSAQEPPREPARERGRKAARETAPASGERGGHDFRPDLEGEEAGGAPEEASQDTSAAEPRWVTGQLRRARALASEACRGWRGLAAAGVALFCLGALTAGLLTPQARPREAAVPAETTTEADKLSRTLEPFIFAGSPGDEETIFKVGLVLEFADEGAVRRFEAGINDARNDIYHFLSRKVERKSLDTQKSELQEAVRDLLNARLGPGQVVKVYFSEFLAV